MLKVHVTYDECVIKITVRTSKSGHRLVLRYIIEALRKVGTPINAAFILAAA